MSTYIPAHTRTNTHGLTSPRLPRHAPAHGPRNPSHSSRALCIVVTVTRQRWRPSSLSPVWRHRRGRGWRNGTVRRWQRSEAQARGLGGGRLSTLASKFWASSRRALRHGAQPRATAPIHCLWGCDVLEKRLFPLFPAFYHPRPRQPLPPFWRPHAGTPTIRRHLTLIPIPSSLRPVCACGLAGPAWLAPSPQPQSPGRSNRAQTAGGACVCASLPTFLTMAVGPISNTYGTMGDSFSVLELAPLAGLCTSSCAVRFFWCNCCLSRCKPALSCNCWVGPPTCWAPAPGRVTPNSHAHMRAHAQDTLFL